MALILSISLAGILAAAVGLSITQAVWLRGSGRELGACRDRLDETRQLADRYESERDSYQRESDTTKARLAKESVLRSIAEAQRNTGQEAYRALLQRHLTNATDAEIADAVSNAFRIVPKAVPALSETAGNELIDPESGLPTA